MKSSERSFARRIDLTSLQLFVAVCELGSIGRAAEREFIAASAVSKRLSDLETAVDTPLLYRHSRGVTLTPAGESLLHHARTVLFGLERMQGELSEYADGVRGHVRMHANISAIFQFLPEDLGAFARLHSQIKIDLQEHLSSAVLHAVQEGAADLGICNLGQAGTAPGQAQAQVDTPFADPPGATAATQRLTAGLQSRPYRTDRLMLVVPQGHALAARHSIAFEEVLDWDIVGLHANSSISLAMRAAAATAGRTLRQRIQVTGLDAMCRMIDNGLGVGLLPDRAFELMQGVGRLHAVPLTDAWAHRELRVVARDFDALPVTARLLVEHLAPRELLNEQTATAAAAPAHRAHQAHQAHH
ncbi:MAG: LysR family transcriptional regulator [Acidovorax sp.]|jgi:DNA-binding transcriptional LysR family regulator|uniref:LysR family transcriptional regulator n=1 Tax=Acidovorax sp. TaxID=1872122 RepID=UPI002624C4D8|nr:LysR family transcriptional regulator [Acidovorax sp.]MDH4426028.1 LysR family transcriptional regulator [Acidovorax sp.]